MTSIPKPTDLAKSYTCVYDAWNRLVEVKDGSNVVVKSEYDGLGRRIKKHIDTDAPGSPDGVDKYRDLFYNASWQIVETRVSTAGPNQHPDTLKPEYQYVWSGRYIDAPLLHDRGRLGQLHRLQLLHRRPRPTRRPVMRRSDLHRRRGFCSGPFSGSAGRLHW